MQNDVQDSEELIDHKSRHIDQLAYEQERMHGHVAELQQTIRAYNNIFAMNRKEFEAQQGECHSKAAQAASFERETDALRDDLSRAASSRRMAIDEAVAEKEDELSKLREFADRKDVVVRQQGDVIARGAAIIQERDATIERLTKELKVSIDDCRNEGRERERSSKLLKERLEEIAHLKNALARDLGSETPTSSPDVATAGSKAAPEVQVSPTPIKPLAFDAQQGYRERSGHWSPQTLGMYAKLPHEQRRAAVWENGPTALDFGKFGHAGEMSLRQSDSLKLLGKLALVEEGQRSVSPVAATPRKLRYKLPLDNSESSRQSRTFQFPKHQEEWKH